MPASTSTTPALTADALDHALHAMLRAGVTQCLPTLITAPEAVLAARLAALDGAMAASRLGPLMVPGFHLEGPFLNPAPGFRGCHPRDADGGAGPGAAGAGDARAAAAGAAADPGAGAGRGAAVIAWAVARGMLVAIGHADAGRGWWRARWRRGRACRPISATGCRRCCRSSTIR